jgi:hypothetical protein
VLGEIFIILSVLVTIYKSLVQSHFDHCSIAFGQFREGLGMQASKITKQSCTDCYGVRLQCSFSLNSLNWYNLEKGRSQQFGVLMYKTINKMVPDYLSSKFTPTNVIHSYNLRHSDSKLFVPKPRPLTESVLKVYL